MSPVKDERIGLPETIRSLRAELAQAMEEGAGQELQFRVGAVELEFEVQVSRETGAEGGIKFWVVSAGARGTTATASTHRVKICLQPQTSEGDDVAVAEAVPRRPT